MLKRLWLWIKRLFHRPLTKEVPFHIQDYKSFHYGKSRSMIVRAGRSMKRGRLLKV